MNITTTSIDKSNIGIIPSSICKCAKLFQYECTSHELAEIFPGQVLMINLIVPRLSLLSNVVTLVVETANLPPNGSTITRASEILQTYTTTG